MSSGREEVKFCDSKYCKMSLKDKFKIAAEISLELSSTFDVDVSRNAVSPKL